MSKYQVLSQQNAITDYVLARKLTTETTWYLCSGELVLVDRQNRFRSGLDPFFLALINAALLTNQRIKTLLTKN